MPCTAKCKCNECKNTVEDVERNQRSMSKNDPLLLSSVKKETRNEGVTMDDTNCKH